MGHGPLEFVRLWMQRRPQAIAFENATIEKPMRGRSTCEGDWEALMDTQETWTRGQRPEVYLQMWHQGATTKAFAQTSPGLWMTCVAQSTGKGFGKHWRRPLIWAPMAARLEHIALLAQALPSHVCKWKPGSSTWSATMIFIAVKRSAVDKMKKLNPDERQGEQVQGHSQSLSLILSRWQFIASNVIKWFSDLYCHSQSLSLILSHCQYCDIAPSVIWQCILISELCWTWSYTLFSGVWRLAQCSSNKHQTTCCVLMSGGLTILPQ